MLPGTPSPFPRLPGSWGRDRAGALRCGFRGAWRSPGAARGLQGRGSAGRGGAGQLRRLPRRRGGRGRALAPPELPRNPSLLSPWSRREARRAVPGECPVSRVPLPFPSSYSPRGSFRMRPRRAGGAPLRLLVVLSQGKRGVCSASAAGGTRAGPEGRREGLWGTTAQAARVSTPIPRGRRLSAIGSWRERNPPSPLSPACVPIKASVKPSKSTTQKEL